MNYIRKRRIFEDWFDDHYSDLEQEFLDSISADEQPLDDDIPDCMVSHDEEFKDFAWHVFMQEAE